MRIRRWSQRFALLAVAFLSLGSASYLSFSPTYATTTPGLFAWGYNSDGELGNGTRTNGSTPVQVSGLTGVTAIAAGTYHNLALERWYVERFLTLRETSFRDPSSYFHHYSRLSVEEAVQVATQIWREINGVNLRENIQPTRERAHLILEKGTDHSVQRVRLRKR